MGQATRSTTRQHQTISIQSIIKRDCLAVKVGVQKFEFYLMGRYSIIEIDHSPLENISKRNISDESPRIKRIVMWCLRFDNYVKYKQETEQDTSRWHTVEGYQKENQSRRDTTKSVFFKGIKHHIDNKRIKDETPNDGILNVQMMQS